MNSADVLIIVGMALAVYVPKVLPLVLVSEHHATRLRKWLEYVAPAVLGALVAPGILLRNGELVAPGPEVAAYAVAGLVAALTRRMVLALAVGAAMLLLPVAFQS
jgi:branched-subunit amino acid transport protein